MDLQLFVIAGMPRALAKSRLAVAVEVPGLDFDLENQKIKSSFKRNKLDQFK